MALNDYNFGPISRQFSIFTVKFHHKFMDCLIVWRVLNGRICCPKLRKIFNKRDLNYFLRFPRSEISSTKDYLFFASSVRVIRSWNSLNHSLRMCKEEEVF